MQKDCRDHKLLDNLTIIANDAKVEVGPGIHTTLRNDFGGTFISWEITDTEVTR